MDFLAKCGDKESIDQFENGFPINPTVKTSRRDLAYVLSKGWNGGTTVAGTLIVSDLVGIKVFATGGIGTLEINTETNKSKWHHYFVSGGVHRDGQNTMDISADLLELGKSSVAVVSSGIKSILDIPRTLEYLVGNIFQNIFGQFVTKFFAHTILGDPGCLRCLFPVSGQRFPSILYQTQR